MSLFTFGWRRSFEEIFQKLKKSLTSELATNEKEERSHNDVYSDGIIFC